MFSGSALPRLPTPENTQAVPRSIDQEPTAVHVISKAKGASPTLASACGWGAGRSRSPVRHLFPTRPESCLDLAPLRALYPEVKSPRASPGRRPPLGVGLRLASPPASAGHFPSGPCRLPSPSTLSWSPSSLPTAQPLRSVPVTPSPPLGLNRDHPLRPQQFPPLDLPFGPLSRVPPNSTRLCVAAP